MRQRVYFINQEAIRVEWVDIAMDRISASEFDNGFKRVVIDADQKFHTLYGFPTFKEAKRFLVHKTKNDIENAKQLYNASMRLTRAFGVMK